MPRLLVLSIKSTSNRPVNRACFIYTSNSWGFSHVTIYTRTGDSGQTRLLNGQVVLKDHLRVKTYGAVDELQSLLGMARVFCEAEDMAAILKKVQVDLFSIGAELACEGGEGSLKKHIGPQDVAYLEERIDQMVETYGMPSGFVVPGEGPGSGATHVARSVCRRCERLMVSFSREEGEIEVLLSYMNRLGDLLFMVAWALEVRFVAKNALLQVLQGRPEGHRWS